MGGALNVARTEPRGCTKGVKLCLGFRIIYIKYRLLYSSFVNILDEFPPLGPYSITMKCITYKRPK